jgi:23S rRNA (adenine2503-C2)-methyltransferase
VGAPYHEPVVYLVHPDQLAGLLPGQPAYRADQLRRWLYVTPVLTAERMTNLPGEVRSMIDLWPFTLEVEQSADRGRTIKWLFRASDGAAIETVLIGYRDRSTVCISSQAGCALGCTFCATGQFGFERHLDAGEIVAQVAFAKAYLAGEGMPGVPERLTNVVFMGMGEPLANYDRVREAVRRIVEEMGMSARSLTLSTVGIVPGMYRLADEPWPLNLAVSLHAADDELRTSLVPINRRYPLAAVEAAAAAYFSRKGRRVSIEWTLIDGVNDTDDQADGLAAIAYRLRAHVNVIALNTTPLSPMLPSPRVDAFVARLRDAGVNATRRRNRGRDIDAACGQLRAQRSSSDPDALPRIRS